MEQVTKDVDGAIALLREPFNDTFAYKTYNPSFLFTTENQEEIAQIVDYKDKDVLTVAASGDQYLASIYYGANEVKIFDINRLTKYITYLKIASIMALSYEEFMNFFVPITKNLELNHNFWNINNFKKVIPFLPKNEAYFWENIIYLFKKNDYGSFVLPEFSYNIIQVVKTGMPFYMNEKEYYILKKLLFEKGFPEFRELDLTQVAQTNFGEEKFDFIYVSNILECLVYNRLEKLGCDAYAFEDYIEQEMVIAIIPYLEKIIKDKGTILLGYRSNKDLRDCLDWIFSRSIFKSFEIPTKRDLGSLDGNKKTDVILLHNVMR